MRTPFVIRPEYTTGQVAGLLRISVWSVNKAVDRGRMPGGRRPDSSHRRIAHADLVAWLAGRPEFAAARERLESAPRALPPTSHRGKVRRLDEPAVVAIRQGVAAGGSCRRVAARYGISRSTVYALATGRMGTQLGGPVAERLPMPRRPDPTDAATAARIQEEYRAGRGVAELAARHGLRVSTVRRILRGQLLGLGRVTKRKGHGLTAAGRARIARLDGLKVREAREARKQGATVQQLADRFGVAFSTMHDAVTGRSWVLEV